MVSGVRAAVPLLGVSLAVEFFACASPEQPAADVHYRPGDPTTAWSEDQLGPEFGLPAAPVSATGSAGTGASAMDPGMMPPAAAGAGGAPAMMPIAGTSGTEPLPMAGMGGTMVTPLPGGGVPTMLTLDFTSVDQNGKYAPKNIGAVWITDGGGRFIRTIEFWAFIRAVYLSKFGAAGAGFAPVDAISSATLPNHIAHHRMWNLADAAGATVPDGAYTITIEVTDQETQPGAWMQIPFMKGPTGQIITPPDEMYFKSIKVTYQ